MTAEFSSSPLFERVERARRRKAKVKDTHVTLAHGSGGKAMRELIEGLFLEYLRNPLLEMLEDQAVFELPEPRHSWNTNHIYSNLISFHLQRHSDHHANALRPYQALRDFADLPRLPSGYPGSFGLAMIPWLWFRVMDPKLMRWAGGDIGKVIERGYKLCLLLVHRSHKSDRC